jgi:hypothetical protein
MSVQETYSLYYGLFDSRRHSLQKTRIQQNGIIWTKE